jgi:hypothetical protein
MPTVRRARRFRLQKHRESAASTLLDEAGA